MKIFVKSLLLVVSVQIVMILFVTSSVSIKDQYLIHLEKAKILIKNQEYENAKDDLDKAILIKPDSEEVYFYLGVVYFHLKDYEAAISVFQKAVKINPNYEKAHLNLGYIYNIVYHDLDKSLIEYTQVLKNNSNSVKALIGTGEIFQMKREYITAKEYFEKVILLDPDNETAFTALGKNYFDLGDYYQSQEEYKKALKINPKYAHALYLLALNYFELKDKDQAITLLENVKSIDPKYSQAYLFLGKIYLSEQNYDKAIHEYESLLEVEPGNKVARFRLVEALNEQEGV